MDIRKLEAYEEIVHEDYYAFTYTMADDIEGLLRRLVGAEKEEDREFCCSETRKAVRILVERVYKEGYLDGYRFCDWLHERTK